MAAAGTTRRPIPIPDWVQINFNGSKTIDRVVVYTVQDNYTNPIEPTDTLTFSALRHHRLHGAGLERFGLGHAGHRHRQQPGQAHRHLRRLHHRSHPDQHHQRARRLLAHHRNRGLGHRAQPACRRPRRRWRASGTPAAVGTHGDLHRDGDGHGNPTGSVNFTEGGTSPSVRAATLALATPAPPPAPPAASPWAPTASSPTTAAMPPMPPRAARR